MARPRQPVMITTTALIEGRPIEAYLGLVAGEAVVGANVARDLIANIRDLVGGRSTAYERLLARARDGAPGPDGGRGCRPGRGRGDRHDHRLHHHGSAGALDDGLSGGHGRALGARSRRRHAEQRGAGTGAEADRSRLTAAPRPDYITVGPLRFGWAEGGVAPFGLLRLDAEAAP